MFVFSQLYPDAPFKIHSLALLYVISFKYTCRCPRKTSEVCQTNSIKGKKNTPERSRNTGCQVLKNISPLDISESTVQYVTKKTANCQDMAVHLMWQHWAKRAIHVRSIERVVKSSIFQTIWTPWWNESLKKSRMNYAMSHVEGRVLVGRDCLGLMEKEQFCTSFGTNDAHDWLQCHVVAMFFFRRDDKAQCWEV